MKSEATQDPTKRIFTLPNLLSFLRLCMIPVIMYTYIAKQNFTVAAVVFFISGATDVIDGYIARTFNMVTDLGKALDPIADKLTQIAMLFCLVSRFHLMIYPLIILTVKEILTGVFALLAIRTSGEVKGAVWHGKLATVTLFVMLISHLIFPNIDPEVSNLLIGISIGAMFYSFIMYSVFDFRIVLGKKKAEENK